MIGPYWVGDSPATPVELELISDEDLAGYATAEFTLTDPEGVEVDTSSSPIADGLALYTFPDAPFSAAGVYVLTPRLSGAGGTVTLTAVRFAVEAVSSWHTIDTARTLWPGAPVDNADLVELLDIARGQVEAYAPDRPPHDRREAAAWRRAQLMQARNIWNATKVDESNQLGGDGFAVTVFPMDWSVKNLIRPKRGVPVVG